MKDASTINSSLSELWQDRLLVDLTIKEEPMEQNLNHEPSCPKVEQDQSPKEAKECMLSMISITTQYTPRHAKISFFPSIPAYREVQNFIDSLDT